MNPDRHEPVFEPPEPKRHRAEAPEHVDRRAFIAAHDVGHPAGANAAASSLQDYLGMGTWEPIAGEAQVPCIERCAFAAVKAWTGLMTASNEIAASRRVDVDTTAAAVARPAGEMSGNYKEPSGGGPAVAVVLG